MPLVRPGRAFTTAGLKVLFALLANPKLAEAPLRTLAGVAGVALGATPPILAGLEKEGHLLVAKRKRHLNATRRLLDEWAAAYARTLRPKTLTTIYEAPAFDQWKVWNLRDAGVRWGGELPPAADRADVGDLLFIRRDADAVRIDLCRVQVGQLSGLA